MEGQTSAASHLIESKFLVGWLGGMAALAGDIARLWGRREPFVWKADIPATPTRHSRSGFYCVVGLIKWKKVDFLKRALQSLLTWNHWKNLGWFNFIRKGKEADGSGVNGNRVIYTVLVKKMENKYIIDRKGILETHLL